MPYDVDIGDGADALGQNQLTDALDGTYWVSGWDATLGTGDLEVDIAAGSGAVAGTDVSTASTQTIDFTGDPDSTDPRKAVIYVDSGGTVQKALGTPQPVDPSGEIRFRTYNPSPPASVSGVVVAEVWLAAGETLLESADVRDRRVSNDAVEAVSNTPNWTQDTNSPQITTGSQSATLNLSETYDIWEVHIKVLSSATNSLISVQVNGDAGANYNGVAVDGTSTSGDSSWFIANSGDQRLHATIKISGRFDDNCHFWGGPGALESGVTNMLQAGGNSNVISPLTSITVDTLSSSTTDIVIEAYGRNIE